MVVTASVRPAAVNTSKPSIHLDTYRCSCGKLLGKLAPGSVAELWCGRCRKAILVRST